MFINDELSLLIKSKYPLIFLETIDEDYTIRQLKTIAAILDLDFYQWSLTSGLKKADNEGSYYQTKEPSAMVRTILSLFHYEYPAPCLFVFKDFNKYLDDSLTLRLFKDLLNEVKSNRNTFVILAPEYSLPKDLEPKAARLVSGYPDEKEIAQVMKETIAELKVTNNQIKISLSEKETEKVIKALKGLSIQQIRNMLSHCVIDNNKLDIGDLTRLESYKKKIFDQEGLLEFCISEDKGNLANFENLKRWLSERKNSFRWNHDSSLPPPKGILLMGVQGCGKSLAIKVITRETNLPLYRLDIGKLYSKYIGETEQNLRKALVIVEKLRPLCLWIDEIEKGFAASSGDIDGGVSQRILGTFLTWMQERKTGCFIAATANDIYRLPPEFLRKGRFDEIFFVDLPDVKARESLFIIHLRKRGLDPEKFDCKLLAEKAVDFSGAEIEQAIISALYRASNEKIEITGVHIIEQIESTKPLSVLKSEDIAALREWAKERTIPA